MADQMTDQMTKCDAGPAAAPGPDSSLRLRGDLTSVSEPPQSYQKAFVGKNFSHEKQLVGRVFEWICYLEI
jgi:hypothetical protein